MDDTAVTDSAPPTSTTSTAGASSTAPGPAKAGRAPGTTFETLAVMGFVFGLFSIVVASFAVGLAARAVSESGGSSGGGSGATAPSTLAVSATEFSFDPSDAEISSTGTITLTNAGSAGHDLVIEDLTTELVEPGATGELVLDGLEPGDYVYYCSIPGHRDAGMEGKITVG